MCNILVGKPDGKIPLGDLCVDGIILKLFRNRMSGCEHGN
jgi:hypothetical protein